MTATRPTPIGMTGRGRGEPAYSGPALAAYRQLHGISQRDLAPRFGGTVSAIAKVEQREVIGERTALRFMSVVDYLARNRAAIRKAGIAYMRHVRDDESVPMLAERVLDVLSDEPMETTGIASALGEATVSDDLVQAILDLYLGGDVERTDEGWRRVTR